VLVEDLLPGDPGLCPCFGVFPRAEDSMGVCLGLQQFRHDHELDFRYLERFSFVLDQSPGSLRHVTVVLLEPAQLAEFPGQPEQSLPLGAMNVAREQHAQQLDFADGSVSAQQM